MKKRKLFQRVISFTLIFTMLFSLMAFAQDAMRIAVIKEISGSVKVRKAGGEKLFPAINGAGLAQGDSIITGANSGAMLYVDGDKEIKVGTNTQLVMSELVKSMKDMGEKTSLSLLSGKVLITINKKLSKDSKFEIKTPTAVMGVRGTTLETIVIGNRTFVTVFEGSVNARNTVTDKDTDVGPMRLAELSSAADPGQPIETKPVDIKTLEIFELEGLKDNPKLPPEIQQQIKEQYDIKLQEQQNQPPAPPPTDVPPPQIIYGPTPGAPTPGVPQPTQGPSQPPAPTGTTPAPTGTVNPASNVNPATGNQPPSTRNDKDNGGGGGNVIPTLPATIPVTSVTITSSHTDGTIGVGNIIQMSGTVLPANATNKNITWSVVDPSTGQVSTKAAISASTGRLIAREAGTILVRGIADSGVVAGTKTIIIGSSVSADKQYVATGDVVTIRVNNAYLNKNPLTIDTVTVNVKENSLVNPQTVGETAVMSLSEESANSGTFIGSIGVGSNQGEIKGAFGDALDFTCVGSPGMARVYVMDGDLRAAEFKYATSESMVSSLLTSNAAGLDIFAYRDTLSAGAKAEVVAGIYDARLSFTDQYSIQTELYKYYGNADKITLTENTATEVAKYRNASSVSEITGLLDCTYNASHLNIALNEYDDLAAEKTRVDRGLYDYRRFLTSKIAVQKVFDILKQIVWYEKESIGQTPSQLYSTLISSLYSANLDPNLTEILEKRIGAISILKSMKFNGTVANDEIILTGYFDSSPFITIPSSIYSLPVTEIGDELFKNNTTLQNIVIPGTVKFIGVYAFKDCTNLNYVLIPGSVEGIGTEAFYGCTALMNAYFYGNAPSVGSSVFTNCNLGLKVIHPPSKTGYDTSEWIALDCINEVGTPVTAIGSITGTPSIGGTVGAGTVTPAGAIVQLQWETMSPDTGSNWQVVGGDQTFLIQERNAGCTLRLVAFGIGTYGDSAISGTIIIPKSNDTKVAINGGGVSIDETNRIIAAPLGMQAYSLRSSLRNNLYNNKFTIAPKSIGISTAEEFDTWMAYGFETTYMDRTLNGEEEVIVEAQDGTIGRYMLNLIP